MSRTDQVMAAVRRIDRLEEQRRQAIEAFDADLAAARSELAQLIDDQPQKPKGRESKIGDQIVDAIRRNPAATNGELATAIYGKDDSVTRHKIRAQRFNLKSKGRVGHDRDRGWYVIEPVANGHAGAGMH